MTNFQRPLHRWMMSYFPHNQTSNADWNKRARNFWGDKWWWWVRFNHYFFFYFVCIFVFSGCPTFWQHWEFMKKMFLPFLRCFCFDRMLIAYVSTALYFGRVNFLSDEYIFSTCTVHKHTHIQTEVSVSLWMGCYVYGRHAPQCCSACENVWCVCVHVRWRFSR